MLGGPSGHPLPDQISLSLTPRGWQMEVCPLRLRISWSFFPALFTEMNFKWKDSHETLTTFLPYMAHLPEALPLSWNSTVQPLMWLNNSEPTKMQPKTERGCSAYNEWMKGCCPQTPSYHPEACWGEKPKLYTTFNARTYLWQPQLVIHPSPIGLE